MSSRFILSSSILAMAAALALGAPALAQSQPPGAMSPGSPPPESEAPANVQPPRTYQAPQDQGTGTPQRSLPAPDSPSGVAPDRTDLGRDCANIDSRVQRTICLNRDLAALDRDARRLGGAGHAAFTAQLESCAAASNTVYDGPIYRCVKARYEARLVQLSRQAGATMSGQYRLMGGAIQGNMTVIEHPQQHVTVLFDKITAAGARACTFRMDAPASAGVIEGTPAGLPGCRVSVAIRGGTATVQSNGCVGLCEMGERVDGTYLSLQAIAPAARPTRTPPARQAPPKQGAPKY
jgi:hypothetical protein